MAISSTKDRAPIIWSKSLVATLLNQLWYWMKHLRNQAIKQHEITAHFPAAMNGLFLWGNCTRTSRLTSSKRLSKADREKCQPCPRNQHRGNFAFPVCSAGSANPSFCSFIFVRWLKYIFGPEKVVENMHDCMSEAFCWLFGRWLSW